MTRSIISLISFLFPLFLLSQQSITGTITSEDGQPLPGATIIVSGTDNGTTSDFDGNFTLNNVPEDGTLTVTYIGFNSLIVDVNSQSTFNLSLTESAEALSEVVVTGYSTERRVDLTGAVSVVELDAIEGQARTAGNPMQALQGRVPGLYFQRGGDMMGSTGNDLADRKNPSNTVLVRGLTTLGDNSPLYVIDGVPTKRQSVFASLNPQSIESVQILKDASAASIYGSRAANGVIIVTTKNEIKGEEKIVVNFNSSISSNSERGSRWDVANAVERGELLWQASLNDGNNPSDAYGTIYNFNWNNDFANPVLSSVTPQPFVGGDPNMPSGDTDWQEELFETGYIFNNEISVQSDTKNSTVFMSLGHFKNTGMTKYTDYERINAKLNSSFNLIDGKVKIGINTLYTNSNETLGARDVGGATTTRLAATLAPTIPLYDVSGVKYGGPIGAGYSDRNNPVLMQFLNEWDNTAKHQFFGNVFLEAKLLENLVFRSNVGIDYATNEFVNIERKVDNGFVNRGQNSLINNHAATTNTTWSNTINYNTQFDNHNLGVLIGVEAIQNNYERKNAIVFDFAVENQDYFVLSAATGQKTANGISLGSSLYSQFGKINYSFSNKYLATFTIRRDGSSRFGINNRYGVFPAGTIGWKISEEEFINNEGFINNLKIRAGYGIVGNQEIGDVARFGLYETRYGTNLNELQPGFWQQFYNIGTAYDIAGNDSGTLPSGFVSTQAANPDLRWEETSEINIGLDFTLMKNVLSGSFDYYSRETKDILTTPPYPSVLGEGQDKTVNGATTKAYGWELQLGYSKPNYDGFGYSIITTFGAFQDEIIFLPSEVISAYPGTVDNSILGQSQTAIFGYQADGLFQSQSEVDSHATQLRARPGGIRFSDLNNDGVVDVKDRDFIGNTLASLEYGVRIDLNYKAFDLSIFGSGISGRITNMPNSIWISTSSNSNRMLLDAWTPQNTSATIPALSLVNSETRTSSYLYENSSFFKFRNVQLGYTLRNGIDSLEIDSLRLFLQGENLAWFAAQGFTGVDPERIDGGQVPIPRTVTFGINVSL
tara:strand:- start:7337 stop:10501 length:3165 start_codon:yes stop_codon:yes gene_type:complete